MRYNLCIVVFMLISYHIFIARWVRRKINNKREIFKEEGLFLKKKNIFFL